MSDLLSPSPAAVAAKLALEDQQRLEAELDAGWKFGLERDALDPRFVTLTCRHPYDTSQALPPASSGELAQIEMVCFAVSIVAMQGIIPPQLAMQIQQQLGAAAAQVQQGDRSSIIIPGTGH